MKKFLLLLTVFTIATAVSAQWPTNTKEAVKVTETGQNDYGCQVAVTADGTTYVAKIVPERPGEAGRTMLSYRLYILDKNGVLKSPEDGINVSTQPNRSWTAVNDFLYADRDGNAIVMCCDSRYDTSDSNKQSYTIYKISPEGETIWSVDLSGGETYELPVCINCVQDTDGNYIIAYCSMDYESSPSKVIVEKITKEAGESVWTHVFEHETRPYSYPHLVASDDNNVIIFYAYTSNQYIYAQKLDKDGNEVWESDARIYRGGFDQIPIHTHIKTFDAPDGGAIFSWRDDRYNAGCFSSYLSYLKADGSYGFPGETDALKICHDEDNSRRSAYVTWSEPHNCFYAVFQVYNQAYQQWQGLYVQKISKDGELLWGDNGMDIEPLDQQNIYTVPVVKTDNEGNPVIFYMKSKELNGYQPTDIQQCAVKFDSKGYTLWEDMVNFDTYESYKTNLHVSDLIDNKYWIVTWADNRAGKMTDGSSNVYATRLNVDGTIGDQELGISQISTSRPTSEKAIFDLTGRRVSNPAKGVYIINGKKAVIK